MGNWSYGPKGEWTKSGMMQVQYHDIKEGETWKGMNYQTVLTPPSMKTGDADLSLREGEVSGSAAASLSRLLTRRRAETSARRFSVLGA